MKKKEWRNCVRLQREGVLLGGEARRAVGGEGDAVRLGRGVDAGRHGLLAAVDEYLTPRG